ncbi:hypothetical protein ACSQ67_011808 [Phaseolus vulgaris]
MALRIVPNNARTRTLLCSASIQPKDLNGMDFNIDVIKKDLEFQGDGEGGFLGQGRPEKDYDRDPELGNILGSFLENPQEAQSQLEDRLRKKRNKVLHTKTGSGKPMKVSFNKNEGRKEDANGSRKQGLLMYERRKKEVGPGDGERRVGKITTWIGGREGVEESGFAIMQREVGEYQEEDRGKRNWGGEKEGETECREDFLVCDVFVFGSENLALLHMTLWVHGGLECGLQLDGKMLGLWELFEFSNSYIWFEFYNVPLAKDISLICDTIRSWHIIGRLGGCNALNMQLSQSPLDARPSYDYIQGANVEPTTFYNIGNLEVQDNLARIWVDIGTVEPLLLDVLINALTQISSDFVGIKQVMFGGAEFESWNENLKSEEAGYGVHKI